MIDIKLAMNVRNITNFVFHLIDIIRSIPQRTLCIKGLLRNKLTIAQGINDGVQII